MDEKEEKRRGYSRRAWSKLSRTCRVGSRLVGWATAVQGWIHATRDLCACTLRIFLFGLALFFPFFLFAFPFVYQNFRAKMEGFAGKAPADFVDGEIYPPIAPAWLWARMGNPKEPGSFTTELRSTWADEQVCRTPCQKILVMGHFTSHNLLFPKLKEL